MDNISQIKTEIEQIKESLERISEYMAWTIKPTQRFIIGQRVEWSRKARKQGYPTRKIAQKGTVKAINSFTITVKLDGLKKVKNYHHAFFNPVLGQKLF
jgi:hypothetical protein